MSRQTPTPTDLIALEDLHPDPRPANRGTARGQEALAHSLGAYGAGRSIVVDRHGHVIAGNKTLAEAQALGLPLTVVRTDGRAIVAVQRVDLDLTHDARARELALADNRVGELNLAWDETLLGELVQEGLRLEPFWTPEELRALRDDADADDRREDAVVVAPPDTTIQPGALFALGTHRLLCGDATCRDDVARLLGDARPALMVTDPPYGVRYDPTWRVAACQQARTAIGAVANDDCVDWAAAYRLFPGDIAYVWHAGVHTAAVATSLTTCDFTIRAQLVWAKQHFALSRGHYHWQHEPCWYAVRRGRSARWRGGRAQSTLWTVPNLNSHGGDRTGANAATGHSTQKPIALFERPIAHHTSPGDPVYDPFVGSGTALIAAEQLGRRCYALDLDPRYVQATVTRWETLTGQRALALAEGDGR